jgi:hypothetical protein
MNKKNFKVHQITPKGGKKLEKKLTRIEALEKAVRELAGLPNFLLQRFQTVLKTVEDLRFTYEVIGQILQEKNIITQEELTAKGNDIIEERKKERAEQLEKLKEQKENIETEDDLKREVAQELMQPNEELQEKQIQTEDVSIKEII